MERIISGLCIIVSIIALIALAITSSKQKYKILLVRIEEALKNIEYFLEKKEENLKKAIPIIQNSNKKKYEKEEILSNLIKNKNIKHSLHEQDQNLRTNLKEFRTLLEDDEKLTKIKELTEIYYDSIEIENDLNASKKYYNKIAKKIDEYFQQFPNQFLKQILKYEKLERFNTKKEETLEILKDQKNEPEKIVQTKTNVKKKEKKKETKTDKKKKKTSQE